MAVDEIPGIGLTCRLDNLSAVCQESAGQDVPGQSPALHMLPGAAVGPPQASLLNVQNLYHIQLAQAPLAQSALVNKPSPSLLHLTHHLEHDQQHQQQQLDSADQLDHQQDLLSRLDDTDPGEASMPLPPNTDYKHKPRRKATERPSVSSTLLCTHL